MSWWANITNRVQNSGVGTRAFTNAGAAHGLSIPAWEEAVRGDYLTKELVTGFAHNDNIGITIVPISDSGTLQTPTALTALEVLSDSANDTSGGSGARTVTIEGIGAGWVEVSETVALNGVTPVPLINTYYRVNDFYVATSGTYATQAAGSHGGNVTLRSAGPTIWAQISYNIGSITFAMGRAGIAAYCVPLGKTAYLKSISLHVDSKKAVSIIGFYRTQANVVAAPFSPMRKFGEWHGLVNPSNVLPAGMRGPFVGPTDIGFMGWVDATTGGASVNFELLLEPTV